MNYEARTMLKKFSKFLLVFVIITGWIFSGWPQIWNNPSFPPEIQEAHATTDTFTLASGTNAAGYGSWIVPTGVTSADAACWGAGGGGGDGTNAGGAGGGGGAMASSTISSLVAGTQYTIFIGAKGTGATAAAGTGGNGGNSTFATTTVVAAGGTGGPGANAANSTGGAGGTVAASTGTTRNAGGQGGGGLDTGDKGGGGGGAAGPHGDGGAGSGQTGGQGDNAHGGAAGAPGSDNTLGGGGGTGGGNAAAGAAGGVPGGGGGGGEGNGADGGGGQCSVTYTAAASDPAFTQAAYRWFANNDATTVGGAVALNTPTAAPTRGNPFRLRLLLHNTPGGSSIGGSVTATTGKLQFAQQSGACDTSFSGESYSDITAATAIAYYNNSSPTDGAALTLSGQDPRYATSSESASVVAQSYEELNNFTISTTIPNEDSGMWDFALVDLSAPHGTTYCFRTIDATTGTRWHGYNAIPEITTEQRLKVRLRGQIRLRVVRLF